MRAEIHGEIWQKMPGNGFAYGSRLHLDDALRTSRLPAWRAGLRFARSLLGGPPAARLQAATDYLMHRPTSACSGLALRRGAAAARAVQAESATAEETTVIRTVVAKSRVSDREPGAILVSFEAELGKILSLRRFDQLQRDYRILFMPSWQNFFTPEVLRLDEAARAPYYILPSAFDETALRPLLGRHARFLPFHAASWVNHERYPARTKDLDLVMLANFQRFKRHWRLFEALADMDSGLRVRLLGAPLGDRMRAHVLEEARAFGVADRVEILEHATQETIRETLGRARLFCAMSHREGSYVGVAEALLAGAPVAMFANAMIGTKAYINEQTGFLLDPGAPLAPQLTSALVRADDLDPRGWAVANISAAHNCDRLNGELRREWLAAGHEWTADVPPFYCVRFDFFYEGTDPRDDAGAADDYARLARDYGLEIARAEPLA